MSLPLITKRLKCSFWIGKKEARTRWCLKSTAKSFRLQMNEFCIVRSNSNKREMLSVGSLVLSRRRWYSLLWTCPWSWRRALHRNWNRQIQTNDNFWERSWRVLITKTNNEKVSWWRWWLWLKCCLVASVLSWLEKLLCIRNLRWFKNPNSWFVVWKNFVESFTRRSLIYTLVARIRMMSASSILFFLKSKHFIISR